MVKWIYFIVSIQFLFACSAPRISIIDPLHNYDYIQLCTYYDQLTPEGYRNEVDAAMVEFMDMHNSSSSSYKVTGCTDQDSLQTIRFYFEPPNYVSENQNAAATVGNVLGVFAVPIGMVAAGSEFFIWFYFWPDTKTNVFVNVSEDLVGAVGPEFPMVLSSPGYFTSLNKQNLKQGTKFYQTLHLWFSLIEQQRKQSQNISSR